MFHWLDMIVSVWLMLCYYAYEYNLLCHCKQILILILLKLFLIAILFPYLAQWYYCWMYLFKGVRGFSWMCIFQMCPFLHICNYMEFIYLFMLCVCLCKKLTLWVRMLLNMNVKVWLCLCLWVFNVNGFFVNSCVFLCISMWVNAVVCVYVYFCVSGSLIEYIYRIYMFLCLYMHNSSWMHVWLSVCLYRGNWKCVWGLKIESLFLCISLCLFLCMFDWV